MSAMSTSTQSTNERETESSSSPLSSSTETKSNILSSRLKVAVHVEAEIKRSCRSKAADVGALVKERLSTQYTIFQNGWIPIPDDLLDVVQSILVADLPLGQKVSFWQADIVVHAFRMLDEEPEAEFLEGEGADLPLGEQLELPNRLLAGLWDSIVVEDSIKSMLLNYCCTSLLFAGNNVNANLISWNKMILLHGPPGTGKTSLCKALAQKICIRNASTFKSGLLFEVNCHSLFSKWFSESGKLVMKLFQHISDIAEDETCLVVLLIDEVESIAAARNNANRSGEPGDAIRVVNAVLTSLDQLRRRKNVLVMCTSNMVATLDEAFVDRLDLNIYIGNPSVQARQDILASCVTELIDRKLIGLEGSSESLSGDRDSTTSVKAQYLRAIAEKTEGYSGRALRKLPVKAFAQVVGREKLPVEEYLAVLLETVA